MVVAAGDDNAGHARDAEKISFHGRRTPVRERRRRHADALACCRAEVSYNGFFLADFLQTLQVP